MPRPSVASIGALAKADRPLLLLKLEKIKFEIKYQKTQESAETNEKCTSVFECLWVIIGEMSHPNDISVCHNGKCFSVFYIPSLFYFPLFPLHFFRKGQSSKKCRVRTRCTPLYLCPCAPSGPCSGSYPRVMFEKSFRPSGKFGWQFLWSVFEGEVPGPVAMAVIKISREYRIAPKILPDPQIFFAVDHDTDIQQYS